VVQRPQGRRKTCARARHHGTAQPPAAMMLKWIARQVVRPVGSYPPSGVVEAR
jgi:hypothetical protein